MAPSRGSRPTNPPLFSANCRDGCGFSGIPRVAQTFSLLSTAGAPKYTTSAYAAISYLMVNFGTQSAPEVERLVGSPRDKAKSHASCVMKTRAK
jgi:hypothetical protein